MKLSVSNIAWDFEQDSKLYSLLYDKGYSAIEIAPTRIVRETPYSKNNIIKSARIVSNILKEYNLGVCSMQSVLFGRSENIFGHDDERLIIYDYVRKSIDYASAISCKHIVFGCPKNRVMSIDNQLDIAADFFLQCANYAKSKEVIIGLEANPKVYGTNFMNTTKETYRFVSEINHSSLRLNLDVGTILQNDEDVKDVSDYLDYISHVHISEPFLKPISKRVEHEILKDILNDYGYSSFVSIEMKNSGEQKLCDSIDYISSIFNR